MASRKQNSFDNQNSDDMGAKDNLVPQTTSHRDPYRAKASEFPVTSVTPANGQGSDDAGQKDKLVSQSYNQIGPRHTQDGPNKENDSMQENAAAVASNFKVSRNQGESSVAPGSPSFPESIDLGTGKISSKGYSPTRLDEVPDKLVTI